MTFIRHGDSYIRTIDVRCGEQFDCFFAFTFWRGSFWSANRRHFMFEPDKWPQEKEGYLSRIILTEWSEQSFGLMRLVEIDLGSGNDPRIVTVGGRPIVLYRGALHDQTQYYLYDMETRKTLAIQIEDDWFEYGKNWIPFDADGMIGAVHSFAPFRILQIDPNNGKGRIVAENRNSFNPKAAHDNFNIFRGGSNALKMGNKLLGFGHATFNPWRHHPFLWEMSDDRVLITSTSVDFDTIYCRGFGIIDPTSLFYGSDERIILGICGSERDWFFDQRFVEALLPINVNRDDQFTKLSVDVSVFKDFPSSFMLVASELQSDISTRDVPFGGRCSSELEGVLSFGPFISLEPGQYHLVFRYRADGSIYEECGWADGSVCILGSARSLGKIILTGTDGKTDRAHLFINIELKKHERFSIRVYTNGLRTVTLFDVRVDLIRRQNY